MMIKKSLLDQIDSRVEFDSPRTKAKLWLDPTADNFIQSYIDSKINCTDHDLIELLVEVLPHIENKPMDKKTFNNKEIASHYDVSNDFYELWLDPSMTYTCGYFSRPDNTLEQAQVNKMRITAQALGLKQGMSVCDLGSGWGASAHFLETQYKARVDAFNISEEQVKYARGKFKREGRYHLGSWKNVDKTYDRIMSIGMLEHIGEKDIKCFFLKLKEILKSDGKALIHAMGTAKKGPTHQWISNDIFPGGYFPDLGETCEAVGLAGLEITKIDNWREHYIKTTLAWFCNFIEAKDQILKIVGFNESEYRRWKLYLAVSVASFRISRIQLYRFQIVHRGVA